jgi:hypothetical protein
MARDWPARRNRALARRLRAQGIIAESSALRVLLDPNGRSRRFHSNTR